MAENTSDVDVLIPKPVVYKIAGEELRQSVLPLRKLLAVIQYVEKNGDLLESFKALGKPLDEGGKTLAVILEEDVARRVNVLVRMLMPGHDQILTDEWCLDHLSPAHYVAFVKTALVQNQLYQLFTKAKDLLGPQIEQVFRQRMAAQAAAPTPGN